MSKYLPYTAYQDSENLWLGNVPAHWIVTELKRYCFVSGGYAFSSDSFKNSGKPVIRIGDISPDGAISLKNCKFVSEYIAEQSQGYLVEKGQLLMAMTGATIGKAGFYEDEKPALVNQRVGKFEVENDALNYRFLWYTLKTKGYQEYIKLTAFGGAQPNISDTAMVAYCTAFPPLNEQVKIAEFLDHETTKIDTLIDKQQQLIKLLKEKRQAVISHAVTKGISYEGKPEAPMKYSGVEWLGEVPEHWKVVALKHLVSAPIIDGPHLSPKKMDTGVPFISAEAIRGGKINFDKKWGYISHEDHETFSKRYNPQVGDLLIVKLGATTGAIAIVETDEPFNVWVPLATVRTISSFDSKYAFYLFQSSHIRDAIQQSWTFGTQQTLGLGTLANLRMPVPPSNECKKIIEAIELKVDKYDAVIDKAISSLELLKERRTTLISAAVTGKIDVRNWNSTENKAIEKVEVTV